jgi:hypothetical protein
MVAVEAAEHQPKVLAPMRMGNDRLVMRVVVRITPFSIYMDSRPFRMVRIKPPAAPIAAPSVGEAIPTKIEPSTATMRTKAGARAMATRLRACLRKAAISASRMGGARSGLSCPRMAS